MAKQAYKRIPREQIEETMQYDPTRAMAMVIANMNLKQAERQAQGLEKREPGYHEDGWNLSIHDGEKLVGLWSCWLKNQFYLGYPKGVDVPDELIMQLLDVTYAKPVRQVSAIAVNDWNYSGECKDPDKPLEKNEVGQIVAYQDMGLREWARFYGPQLPNGKGRVWIDKSDFHLNGFHFPIIDESGNVSSVYCGHDKSNGIFTEGFNFYNKYAPEGPSADPEAIQSYRDKFIRLATKVALMVAQPTAVTVDYGFVMVPEDLKREGYSDITWLKGKPDVRKGLGNELVRAKKENEVVILKSGNSLVPWSTVRQMRVPESAREKDSLYELVNGLFSF
jgi:hypothetical protein